MQTNSALLFHLRHAGLWLCKHFPPARRLRYTYWNRRAKQYARLSRSTQTNPKQVVFEAFGGRGISCSPRAIYLAMCANPRFDDWTLCWSFKDGVAQAVKDDPLLERAKVIVRGSEEYYHAFAQSKYWVQNNRVPEYIEPRADQVYVQCWHGTPLKRLGYDIPESFSGGALNTTRELADRFKLDTQKWSYLISPSGYTSQHLCDAFGVPEERRASVVLEAGYPRNDEVVATLSAPDAKERMTAIRERLGVPAGKKVLLFAPTWRDDQFQAGVGYTMDSVIDFDLLRERLGNEWVVLLRLHYYIANELDFSPWEGFVFDVSHEGNINELYCAADALCTDYSSVFFDYANTGRPLYFYWPDREHYENDLHGFYLDVNTLPGPKCETAEQLCDALAAHDAWHGEHGAAYAEFRATFCANDDGHASERVIERVFGA